jgi:GNAT superfamily N-acetyltransferase
MRIREVVLEDRTDLLRLLEATGVFRKNEIQVADEVIAESLSPTSDYQSLCYVNEENRPVGYVCWGATPCTLGTYDLYWIAVHPDFQGNGIGQELLRSAENFVKGSEGRLLLIETSSQPNYENTRQFYVRMGYRQLAMVSDFYCTGDHKIIYGKNFIS